MSPKRRGQPNKPAEKKRVVKKVLRYSQEEIELLEKAYQIIGEPNTFARWLASTTLDEAKRIVEDSDKK